MSTLDHIDPDILNDFVTESNELIEQLDQDLVQLEHRPDDLDLINSIFRPLHTIKGSAGFLSLDTLRDFVHAAEDALNAMRKGEAKVTMETMDLLLKSVDLLRGQMEEVEDQRMPTPVEPSLIEALKAIGAGDSQASTPAKQEEAPQKAGRSEEVQLELADNKMDLLPFMASDLIETISTLTEINDAFETDEDRATIAGRMLDVIEELRRLADFFEVDSLCREIDALRAFAQKASSTGEEIWGQTHPRVIALLDVMSQQANVIGEARLLALDTTQLTKRLLAQLNGEAIDEDASLGDNESIEHVLQVDQVVASSDPESDEGQTAASSSEDATENSQPDQLKQSERRAGNDRRSGDERRNTGGEQTIRVDISRLENLLNLVGELVLQKNRVGAMTRKSQQLDLDQDFCEELSQISSDLDRVTGDLQMSVMKTRLQPMNKVFGRFPRLIRDLARSTNKNIDLQITGGDTEVDKSVIEAIGDPLVHILRNSSDHGIETPDERATAGKPENATIQLSAQHEGNHVVIRIADDGRGINPKVIAKKALEKGVVTEDQLNSMTDHQIIQMVFAAGFSTAEKVSNLSGRGVGMDVVRTNITALNGFIDLTSEFGKGTTVTFKIPLTVAIMPAMMVEVGNEMYAVPLPNILEIVRPEETQFSSVKGRRVMKLREDVLPVIELNTFFRCEDAGDPPRFAVVVEMGDERLALMVNSLIGQQEVVIKPLDNYFEKVQSINGATVRDDGGVSLIADIAGLVNSIKDERNQAA